MDFCGECSREINISNPTDVRHVHDGTSLCVIRRRVARRGNDLVFKVDTETRAKIAASTADPRDRNNWETRAAADGNKGYRVWKPTDEQLREDK